MKKSILISFAYIAAVIGAGFASGAEVVSFFLVYGKQSIIGLVLSGLFFGVFSYILLSDCVKNRICDFSDYLEYLMPPFWRKFTSSVVFVFMAVSLAAMSAAAGEIMSFKIPEFWGILIFSLVCALILRGSVGRLTYISGILGIIIAVGIVISCYYVINFRTVQTFSHIGKISISAVSYSAYNSIAAAVLLCSMSRFLKTKKQVLLTSLFNGIGVFVILAALWCVVGIYYGKVDLGEIPMLAIARRQNLNFSIIYGIILFLAVLTTAVSNGFGVTEYVKEVIPGKNAILIPFVFMLFLSGMGFSVIVDVAYRICGYASVVMPVFMIINRVKKRKRKKTKEKRK